MSRDLPTIEQNPVTVHAGWWLVQFRSGGELGVVYVKPFGPPMGLMLLLPSSTVWITVDHAREHVFFRRRLNLGRLLPKSPPVG